jgi:nitrite reductase/ring-hydroxylating ferredoxin subunit
MFPNVNEKVDMNTLFIGQDAIFCKWHISYFNYKRGNCSGFNIKKIKGCRTLDLAYCVDRTVADNWVEYT